MVRYWRGCSAAQDVQRSDYLAQAGKMPPYICGMPLPKAVP